MDNPNAPHEWLLLLAMRLCSSALRHARVTRKAKACTMSSSASSPLADAVPQLRLWYSYFTDRPRGGGGELVDAELTFTVVERFRIPMPSRDERDAFLRFIRELRAVISRAHAVRGAPDGPAGRRRLAARQDVVATNSRPTAQDEKRGTW